MPGVPPVRQPIRRLTSFARGKGVRMWGSLDKMASGVVVEPPSDHGYLG